MILHSPSAAAIVISLFRTRLLILVIIICFLIAGDVVVHIFLPQQRAFYNIEEFYANATPIELPFENQPPFRSWHDWDMTWRLLWWIGFCLILLRRIWPLACNTGSRPRRIRRRVSAIDGAVYELMVLDKMINSLVVEHKESFFNQTNAATLTTLSWAKQSATTF